MRIWEKNDTIHFMEQTECKEFISKIPVYLDGKLGARATGRLLEHLKTCGDCRDEMEINFLLREGIRRVENGETLDLENELDRKLQESEDELVMLERIRSGIYIIEGTAAFLLAACLLIMTISG